MGQNKQTKKDRTEITIIYKYTEVKREKSFNISIFVADGRKYLEMMTLPRCASICCRIAHTEKPCSLQISQELSQTKHIN